MALPKGLMLEVSVDCEAWLSELPEYEDHCRVSLEQVVMNVPEGIALDKFSHIELSIVLCDDALIHKLNSDFRDKKKATNVLSFCGLEEEQVEDYLRAGKDAPEFPHSLGEIYIAYETMMDEAGKANISIKEHFLHLTTHGILHLLGYDHIIDEEAVVMEALEMKLLCNLGIDDPYRA